MKCANGLLIAFLFPTQNKIIKKHKINKDNTSFCLHCFFFHEHTMIHFTLYKASAKHKKTVPLKSSKYSLKSTLHIDTHLRKFHNLIVETVS